mmetsp:Transcript_24927/g.23918  ORF Transcript_24927/g.23918 Transcript_24927/m.23918 type:complete len:175 (+) Transcript_24927:145-669(+)
MQENFKLEPQQHMIIDKSSVDILDETCRVELDRLGVASGKAQLLNGPISSVDKILTTNHTIIISYKITSLNKKILNGYLKYGIKDLFFYKKNGIISQCSPICLLDFYVDENVQREGIGLSLFKKMLEVTSMEATHIAYDRPSPKLIAFMRKHYNLKNPDLQPNRFAIFEGFPLI